MSGLEASMIKARNAEKRGDFAEAERLYGAVLEKFPRNARARKGLDDVFKNRALAKLKTDAPSQAALDRLAESYRQGQMMQVVAQAETLLASHPGAAVVHNLLGAAHLTLGQPAQAEAALRRARDQGIDFAPICNNLGMALFQLRRFSDAEAAFRDAIALDPRYAIARNNLGNVLKENRLFLDALAAYNAAIDIQPDYADAYNNLALALEGLGRTDQAQAAYRKVLELQPNHAAAHNNFGNLLAGASNLDGAIAHYEAALRIDPTYPEAHLNLGNAHKRQGRIAEANCAYQRAKAYRPNYADASAEHGKALALEHRFDEAIAALDDALVADPGHASALTHRLFYKAQICDWSAFDEWPRFAAGIHAAFSPFLALTFEDDSARQLQRSRAWSENSLAKVTASLPQPAPSADGRIRIGYFSADFHDHATLYLMAGLLREHDRSRFEIHAYSYGPEFDDAMRDHLLAHVDGFHAIGDMSDAAVMELSRGHGLDIAVDLKGYTQNGRTQLFAHRLAPVQIAYLGYPGTSGADFIDYMIVDGTVVPERERAGHSENLLTLPASYQPNDDARMIAPSGPTRADCGLPARGLVFCCFNQSYKISPREFAIWTRLLDQIEGSVLWLLRSNRWAELNLRREAAARGIAPERLVFADLAPQAEHLARLRLADLFLDTFNVNAHTTASDALWAGVPLVTRAGRQFAARVGASLLEAIGLPELITATDEAYEALILDLAAKPSRIEQIKARLAANRLTQPLFDTARYTRHFEAALAAAHERHVAGLAPAPITIT